MVSFGQITGFMLSKYIMFIGTGKRFFSRSIFFVIPHFSFLANLVTIFVTSVVLYIRGNQDDHSIDRARDGGQRLGGCSTFCQGIPAAFDPPRCATGAKFSRGHVLNFVKCSRCLYISRRRRWCKPRRCGVGTTNGNPESGGVSSSEMGHASDCAACYCRGSECSRWWCGRCEVDLNRLTGVARGEGGAVGYRRDGFLFCVSSSPFAYGVPLLSSLSLQYNLSLSSLGWVFLTPTWLFMQNFHSKGRNQPTLGLWERRIIERR